MRFSSIVYRKLQGFMLFEAALVLCIVGCLSAALIPMIQTAHRYQKSLKTQQTFERTLRLMAIYALSNNRLPNPSLNDNGKETEEALIGKIPHQTLCVEKQNSQSGDGQFLVYVVHPALTHWHANNELEEGSFFTRIKAPAESFQIFEDKLRITPSNANESSDFCALALIHIPVQSSIKITDIVSIQGNNILIQAPPRQTGVIVRWVSRNNLIALYGPH